MNNEFGAYQESYSINSIVTDENMRDAANQIWLGCISDIDFELIVVNRLNDMAPNFGTFGKFYRYIW